MTEEEKIGLRVAFALGYYGEKGCQRRSDNNIILLSRILVVVSTLPAPYRHDAIVTNYGYFICFNGCINETK